MAPQSPDADGSQLAAIQQLVRYIEQLLKAVLVNNNNNHEGMVENKARFLSSWPQDLHQLVEGMPQAVSLVSRIVAGLSPDHDRFSEYAQQPLDHIWLWYDCACLPQIFPNGRTREETHEFCVGLQNLDLLAQKCHLVCLLTKDYYQRAWCAFEHYQKALDHGVGGAITMQCHQVVEKQLVDWCLFPKANHNDDNNGMTMQDEDSSTNNMELLQVLAQVQDVMKESRQEEFETAQVLWNKLFADVQASNASLK